MGLLHGRWTCGSVCIWCSQRFPFLHHQLTVYAEPHLDDKIPFTPMPHWYCAILNADEARFQVLQYIYYQFVDPFTEHNRGSCTCYHIPALRQN